MVKVIPEEEQEVRQEVRQEDRAAGLEERAAGVAIFTPVQVIILQVWELIQEVALQEVALQEVALQEVVQD
jgi:predicted ABC-type sugar transport system permease subunit